MHRGVADKQSPRAFVKIYRRIQKALHDGGQGTKRYETASIFQQKVGGQVESLAANPRPGLPWSEFAVHAVEIQPPDPAVWLRSDRAQRLKDFEQSYIVRAVLFGDRQRVVRGAGIDRQTFLVETRNAQNGSEHNRNAESYNQSRASGSSATPGHRSSGQSAAWEKSPSISAA